MSVVTAADRAFIRDNPDTPVGPAYVLALLNELEAAEARIAVLRDALTTIDGPASHGSPFIEEYRAAGGGYEGLQAMAHAALTHTDERAEVLLRVVEAARNVLGWCGDGAVSRGPDDHQAESLRGLARALSDVDGEP